MRRPELVILSDIHLGTYGLHGKELLNYLQSVEPKTLILNGDIIDIWQFKKSYFPKVHFEIVGEILNKVRNGVQVYYLTGNHDDLLRRFSDFSSGHFHILDKLVLELKGEKYWFFHGDVFDASIQHAKWIAKLGGKGYDFLIFLNRFINKSLIKLGKKPMSFSKKIKDNVKKAVKYIDDFEKTACELGIEKKYQYVVCGHIHNPCIRIFENEMGKITYMNSGDWVENLTSLEYEKGNWQVYDYKSMFEDSLNTDQLMKELAELNP